MNSVILMDCWDGIMIKTVTRDDTMPAGSRAKSVQINQSYIFIGDALFYLNLKNFYFLCCIFYISDVFVCFVFDCLAIEHSGCWFACPIRFNEN